MKKAVLIMNMPETCDECPLHLRDDDAHDWCSPLDQFMWDDDLEKKLDECPLKPLPEKKKLTFAKNENADHIFGWNNCIDQIVEQADELKKGQ